VKDYIDVKTNEHKHHKKDDKIMFDFALNIMEWAAVIFFYGAAIYTAGFLIIYCAWTMAVSIDNRRHFK